MITQNNTGSGNNYFARGNLVLEQSEKIPSALAEVVNILGKKISEEANETQIFNSYQIEEKLSWNQVKENYAIIHEYKSFSAQLDEIYSTLQKNGSNRAERVLQNIRREYVKVAGIFRDEQAETGATSIETIQRNSDAIFNQVENNLLRDVINSSNLHSELEAVKLSVCIVMVNAFIRCKILEEPPK